MRFPRVKTLLCAMIALLTLSVAGAAGASKSSGFPDDIIKTANHMEWDAEKYDDLMKALEGNDVLILQGKKKKGGETVGVTCKCSGESSGTCSLTVNGDKATCGGSECCSLVKMSGGEIEEALGSKTIRGR